MNYCIATHPDKPNSSLNSRGRRYHLTLDNKQTLCKNIVTGLIGAHDDVFNRDGTHNGGKLRWSPTQHDQGLCGNCKNIAKQKNIKFKKMEY